MSAAQVREDPDYVLVRHVSHSYTSVPGQVLDDVSLTLPRGSFTSIIGPSGCGKSTLLRSLAGIETPVNGTLSLFGHSPREAAAEKRIGLVPQVPALLPWLTARRNVELPHLVNRAAARRRRRSAGAFGAQDDVSPPAAALELLRSVGLADAADAYPAQLSGGMQQRVAIARAFGIRPDVLLMDEPFSALDEFTREALRLQLLELWQQVRTTVVFVTHSVREAVVLSDEVVVMSARPGRIHEVVPVDLPRPRDVALLDSPDLHRIEARVRQSLESAWRAGAPPVDLISTQVPA